MTQQTNNDQNDAVAKLYFESHVTIEPIYDEKLEIASNIAKLHGFKIATLLMKKRAEDTETRSQYDTFMTAHSKSLSKMIIGITGLVEELQKQGFKVWRYKIEDIMMDSRTKDVLNLLGDVNE